MKKLSLESSRALIKSLGLQNAFDENPNEVIDVVRRASAEQGQPVDISEAMNANILRKGRAWVSEKTRDLTDEYVREPLTNKFGDNFGTRVVSGAVEGITQSLPELALMGLTRGRGPVLRPLGTVAAGLGSGMANYNQTGDAKSAMVSAGTMAALPSMIRGGQVLASKAGLERLSPISQRLASGAIGAGAGLAGDVVDYAYQPEMEEVSLGELGSVAAPNETVNFTDFGRAAERLQGLDPTTPEGREQLAILALAEAGPATIGLAMDKATRRKSNVSKAQQEIIPLNSDNSNPINYLTQMGRFDIPAKARQNVVDSIYQRYLIEDEPARMSLQYELYNSVPESTLTPEQLARKQELADPLVRARYAERNIANLGNQPSPAKVALDRWQATLANIAEDVDPNFDAKHKESRVSEMLNSVSRTLFDAPQNVETNPVAREIQNLFQRNDTDADRKTNDFIKRLGTIDGEVSQDQASHNLREFINRFNANKSNLKTVLETAWLERNNQINQTVEQTLPDGTKIKKEVRPDLFSELPDLTVEQWVQRGLSEHDAKMARNISMAPTFLAVDSFNTNQGVITNRLAASIMDTAPHIKTANDAHRIAKNITDQAKVIAGEGLLDRQNRQRTDAYNPKELRELDRQLAKKLGDTIWKNVYNSDPATRTGADRMAIALYKSELGAALQYAHNKTEGYMPLVRRGKYKVAWTDQSGEKLFRGFNDKKEFDAFIQQLNDTGATNIHDYRGDYKTNIDAQAFDQVSEIRRSLMEAREMLAQETPGVASATDSANTFVNGVMEATKVFEDQYRNVARSLAQADITKTTTLERRNVGGINPDDLLPNLFELVEGTSRANANKLNRSQIEMLMHDPTIRNNEGMLNYFEQRRKYMSNPDAPEWIPIRNLTSLNYLAGSSSFISQNVTQPYMVGAPLWKTHTGRSLADFTIAAKRAIETLYHYENDPNFKGVDKNILQFLRRGAEDGVFDQSATDETFARRRLKTNLSNIEKQSVPGKLKEGWGDFMKWASQVISGSEEMNRKTSFLQFLESENRHRPLSERTPQELESVYAKARQFTESVNFRGGKSTRPGFIMNLAGADGKSNVHGATLTALSLTNFQRNMFGILFNRLRDTIPGLRDQKAIASARYKNNRDRLALVKMLGAFGAAAGAMGFPIASAFDELVARFGGEDNRPTSNIRERLDKVITDLSDDPEFGRRIADMFMYGLPGALGWNQQNVGMNSVMPVDVTGDITDIFGAPGQMGQNLWDGGAALLNGDIDTFMRSVMPTGLKTFKNALDGLNRGTVENSKGEAVVPEGTLQGASVLSLLAGGAPTEVSNARNAIWNSRKEEQSITNQRKQFMNLLGNNLDFPERLSEAIVAGVDKGIIKLDEQADFNSLMMNLAETSLKRKTPYARYNNLDYLPTLERIYSRYGIDPQYVSPLQQITEAIKIARSIDATDTVMSLIDKFDNDSVFIRDALQKKGVRPDIVNVLLAPELTQKDVELLKNYFKN